MHPPFTILIADRNPNVRGYIGREMVREGYTVRPADSVDELLRLASMTGPVHLVILDPDLPGVAPKELLQQLSELLPGVPLVLHTHDPRAAHGAAPTSTAPTLVVEKSGRSIVRLKQVAEVLAGTPPGSPARQKS